MSQPQLREEELEPADGDGAEPLLALRRITKVYGEGSAAVQALRGVDLDVHPGEFVAVMGASGSGKSTCMNLLGCLDVPTDGHYFFRGVDVAALDREQLSLLRRHYIGFIFQGFNLLARTSALENVELPMLYAGIEPAERHRRATEALHAVGLAGREQNHPNQLSGGQQQRVAIARALVNDPKLILADEPTGNLDSKTSISVMALFQELGRSGITVVLVTHEPDIAEFASRV
ncbi:MAG TPA: ABC transporter ATP-binding protein, partial [Thermoanaerobaculia bacterium]|nr:ABC transporter ATP-binding protein [Thermoanaerobaculia bacterium]